MNDDLGFILAHGHYRKLLSYRKAEIIYDLTYRFCDRFLERVDRTRDQMIQAARSGKQNIAEGSKASGTSKVTEIRSMQSRHSDSVHGSRDRNGPISEIAAFIVSTPEQETQID